MLRRPGLLELPKKMETILKERGKHPELEALPEWDLLVKPLQDEYTEAFLRGKHAECWARYSTCPVSIFSVL